MRPEAWLLKQYQIRQKTNPRFSKRAFAKLLNIPSGRLSEYLEGRRRITLKTAEKIVASLKLSPDESKKFKESILAQKKKEKKQLIPIEHYEFLSDPLVYAVLTAFELQPEGMSKAQVVKILKKNPQQVSSIVDKLFQMNYLAKSEGEKLKRSSQPLATQPIPNQLIRNGHKKRLQDVIERIDEVSSDIRFVTSITIPFNTKKYKKIIELIEKFKDQVDKVATSGSRNHVYNLNIQLFPMSDVSPEDLK